MPSVSNRPSASHAPILRPVDPNRPFDPQAHTARESITHQPSPAIVATASHVGSHVVPRRFIGPMPERVANSKEVEERRRRFRDMRKRALRRIRGDEEDDPFGDEQSHRGAREVVHKIRVRRRGRHGEEVADDIDLAMNAEDDTTDEDDDDQGRDHLGRKKKKKKKQRKDVWVGESFDIGREFLPAPQSTSTESPDGFVDQPVSDTAVPYNKPSNTSQSTMESFVTARTRISGNGGPSKSILSLRLPHQTASNVTNNGQPSPASGSSLAPPDHIFRNSQTSSMRPLIGAELRYQGSESSSISKGGTEKPDHEASENKTRLPGLQKRLKSAIRKSPKRQTSSHTYPVVKADGGQNSVKTRAKTVHFPPRRVSAVQSEDGEAPRKGNKQPASPEAVLAREGGDASGTSAGAAERAMENEDSEEEEEVLPGEVLMRGKSR